jgi:hypothetical protein
MNRIITPGPLMTVAFLARSGKARKSTLGAALHRNGLKRETPKEFLL